MTEEISWILLAALAAMLVAAAVCDLRKREIPHWIVIPVALLAPAFWWIPLRLCVIAPLRPT